MLQTPSRDFAFARAKDIPTKLSSKVQRYSCPTLARWDPILFFFLLRCQASSKAPFPSGLLIPDGSILWIMSFFSRRRRRSVYFAPLYWVFVAKHTCTRERNVRHQRRINIAYRIFGDHGRLLMLFIFYDTSMLPNTSNKVAFHSGKGCLQKRLVKHLSWNVESGDGFYQP